MTAIVATVGSASANSYVTEVEYIAYTATRLNLPSDVTVTGSTATEDEKKALVMATRELQVLSWVAGRTDEVQALQWPRKYAVNPDAPSIADLTDLNLLYFADDGIPQRVKDAQIELALEFLRSGTVDLHAYDPNAGVIEKTVDVLTTKWQPYQRPTGLGRFPLIWNLIAPLLRVTAGSLEIART